MYCQWLDQGPGEPRLNSWFTCNIALISDTVRLCWLPAGLSMLCDSFIIIVLSVAEWKHLAHSRCEWGEDLQNWSSLIKSVTLPQVHIWRPRNTQSFDNEIQLVLSFYNGPSWIEAKWIQVVPNWNMYQEVLSWSFKYTIQLLHFY